MEDPNVKDEDMLRLNNMLLSGGVSLSSTPLSQFLQQPSLTRYKEQPPPNQQYTASVGGSGTYMGTVSSRLLEDDQLIEVDYLVPSIPRSLLMGVLGLVFGVSLRLSPVSKVVVQWIGLFGDLYGRALECLTIPLLFTSVCCCVCHLMLARKAKSVLTRTLVYYVVAAFLSCIVTCAVTFAFVSTFHQRQAPPLETSPILVNIQCPNNKFLVSDPKEDKLACVADTKDSRYSAFKVVDLTGLKLTIKEGFDVNHPIAFSKQTSDFFDVLFPNNIMHVFTIQESLSIFTFATIIGIAIVRNHELSHGVGFGAGDDEGNGPRPSDASDRVAGENYAYMLIKQTNCVLEVILNWFLPWMPLALGSSLTSWIALNDFDRRNFDATASIFGAFGIALVAFCFVVAGSTYYVLLRKNPFAFLVYLLPAMLYLATTSDAIASLPLFMRAIDASKQVSRTLSQTVLSVGVTVSLSGTASFFVLVSIYMAYTSGLEDQVTAARVVWLVVLSAITSLSGAPPLPGSALTRLITIYTTVFQTTTVPGSFAYVAWVEMYFVRMRRMQNFIVVAFTARILADQLDESIEDEQDRQGSDADRLSRI